MKIDPVIGEDIKEEEGEIWDEEALDALFNETVRFSVVNSYVSAITELYAWQLQSEGKASPPLWGAKRRCWTASAATRTGSVASTLSTEPVHDHWRLRRQRA